jgi:hypothetical protein
VPPALLKDKDVGAMMIDEFIQTLAYARYIQEVEADITARAISEVFAEE